MTLWLSRTPEEATGADMLSLLFQEEKEGDTTKDSLDDLFPNEEEEDPSNGCESACGGGG